MADMEAFETARGLLPAALRQSLKACSAADTEEIRLRTLRRASAVIHGHELELGGAAVSENEIAQILEKATGASLHAAGDSIANGFISYRGLRIGLCGEAAMSGGKISGFRSYSSLAIRIPHQCRGVCDGIGAQIFRDGLDSTLVISPPGCGKTTALRELTRILGDSGVRTAVVDERNELSASHNGISSYDLGRCSDVLVNIPKAKGAMMLLRGMNPELIAMDEITQGTDIEAIEAISGCGVNILASAHAKNRDDMLKRPLYRQLLELGIFKWIVTIRIQNGRRIYEAVRLP